MEEEIQQIKPEKDYKIHLAIFLTFFLTTIIVGGLAYFYGFKESIGLEKQVNILRGKITELEKENKELQLENRVVATTNKPENDIEIEKINKNDYELEFTFDFPDNWEKTEETFQTRTTLSLLNKEEKYYLEGGEFNPIQIIYYQDNEIDTIDKYILKHPIYKKILQKDTESISGQTAYRIKGVTSSFYVDYTLLFYKGYIIQFINNSEIIGTANYDAENGIKQKNNIQKVFNEVIQSFEFINEAKNDKADILPDCQDGFTYMSYYPNPDGSLEFQSDFSPSNELKNVRVAYYTFFACSESDEEGYYIKQNGEFKKVEKEEFDKFIEDYNTNCDDCLTEHFDGCC